jgi:hypothetical protein
VTPIDRDKVILAKIAWAERYEGPGGGDSPKGIHKYLRTGGTAHEAFNFKCTPDGRFLGHFPGRHGHVNLKRIDNRESGSELSGVTVIWVSRPPGHSLRVVGWYRNATVFAAARKDASSWSDVRYSALPTEEARCSYMCASPAGESHLLLVEEREHWKLPGSVSNKMRHASVMYPLVRGELAPWVSEIEGLIDRIEGFNP